MRRSATLSLEGFDPEVIEAAREVAQRAGVPLETWIESVVAPEPVAGRPAPNGRRRAPSSRESESFEPESVAHQGAAPPVAPPTPQPPPAADSGGALGSAPGGATIADMMRRLDALDRSLTEDRRAVETRTASLEQTGTQVDRVTERLGEIERRLGDLNGQLTGPRPLGRRGRPLAAEMREAVEDVRRRQRELDAGPASPASARVRTDANAPSPPPSPAIAALQAETSRLRNSLGTLATGRDVGALEQAMRALAADVQEARVPDDLAAIIALMRGQVEQLGKDVADDVHARLAGEVERLARRADGTLDGAAASHADRSALDAVHRELDEIRHLIAGLAGPERIQSLSHGLQAISGQIAQLQDEARAPGVEELRPLLEEIRSGLSIQAAPQEIIGRIEALADRIDRVDGNPMRDLIGRLETLDERMHRPAGAVDEFASIQAMLRALAEKVERVGSGGGNLDALENQVVALANRLESRSADPALASLERTMGELMKQIVALRDEGSVEAAVERATRKAIADTIGAGDGSAKSDTLRIELDDLRARQASADRRMQATMDGLNTVLARLVDRLDAPEAAGAASRASRPDPESGEGASFEHLLASTTLAAPRQEPIPVSAPRSRTARKPEPGREAAADSFGLSDELLEPGAGRPAHARAAPLEPALGGSAPGGDIKTSFIAAARRAAQAAQADLAAEAPTAPERRDAARPRAKAAAAAPAMPGLVGRLMQGSETRRRPLLLGLAAVVLVLGAVQAYQMNFGASDVEAPAVPTIAGKPPAAERAMAEADSVARAPAPSSAAPAAANPQTTQSIADAPAATARAAEENAAASRPSGPAAIPKVVSMASLSRDLSTVPAGLSSLKQAALDGEGAAIYELAAREADGRGMPRDLALAAKLYEKLAEAGYAPAQFKLGSFHEKGSGVIRDLGQAKVWYGRAADRGNIRAMHNLAVLHAENPSASGKPDFATAASWFRRAAEYGVRDSQYNLAVLYARGLGLTQDLVQSYAWFSAAAAQGDDEAGKKRDDVAGKLAAKDLATAKSLAAAFKAKPADPSANDAAPPKVATPPAAMSLLGAPPPGSPSATAFTPNPPRTPSAGV